MNVFAIISLAPNPALGERIATIYAGNFMPLSDAAWLVAGVGTAQDVSVEVGLVSGEFNSAVVVAMANYHGRAQTIIWDWIKSKLEAPMPTRFV